MNSAHPFSIAASNLSAPTENIPCATAAPIHMSCATEATATECRDVGSTRAWYERVECLMPTFSCCWKNDSSISQHSRAWHNGSSSLKSSTENVKCVLGDVKSFLSIFFPNIVEECIPGCTVLCMVHWKVATGTLYIAPPQDHHVHQPSQTLGNVSIRVPSATTIDSELPSVGARGFV